MKIIISRSPNFFSNSLTKIGHVGGCGPLLERGKSLSRFTTPNSSFL